MQPLWNTVDFLGCLSQKMRVYLPANAQVSAAVSDVVEGLFAVCVTLSVVPIIRCCAGGVAEAAAQALSAKIAGHLKGRGATLFTEGLPFVGASKRPLLCLFDRNFDLTPMVEQPFTYKALVHDCQGLRLNKVEIQQGGSEGAPKRALSIEIGEDDAFWQQNGHLEFGVVASSIDEQVRSAATACGTPLILCWQQPASVAVCIASVVDSLFQGVPG
jgi:sec1 family domain-containing protein 1